MNPEDELPVDHQLADLTIADPTSESNDDAVVSSMDCTSSKPASDSYPPHKKLDAKTEDYAALKASVFQEDIQVMLPALARVRNLLSLEHNPPIDRVLEAGMLPRLIHLVGHENEKVQFNAAWALTNIVSGNASQTAQAVEAGVISKFCEVVRSTQSTLLIEQCVWGLGNIAGDSVAHRDQVIAHGLIEDLVGFVKSDPEFRKLSLLKNVAWCMSNLCRKKPAPKLDHLLSIKEVLPGLLNVSNQHVVTDALWVLCYISDIDKPAADGTNAHHLVASMCLPKVVSFLYFNQKSVQVPALRVIGNLTTGEDEMTQRVLKAKIPGMGLRDSKTVLDGLLHVLQEKQQTKIIMKECCWTLSNILAGTPHQVKTVVSHPIFPLVLKLSGCGLKTVVTEIVWCILNPLGGVPLAKVNELVNSFPIFEALANGLKIGIPQEVIRSALNTLDEMLAMNPEEFSLKMEEQGLTNELEKLQNHSDGMIYEKAIYILETYFEVEESDNNDKEESPSVEMDHE